MLYFDSLNIETNICAVAFYLKLKLSARYLVYGIFLACNPKNIQQVDSFFH
jgi:hypothetical protein